MRPDLPTAFLGPPIAHRALHDKRDGRPESSRAAVRAAVAAGYGIEIDLQLSADGQAMVFHDDTLGRLTAESGPLRARSAAELGAIALKHGDGEGVPTLSEILAIVSGRVPLLIEIKDQDGALGPAVGPLEEAAARALAGYSGPVAVMSFNPYSVAAFAGFAPDVAVGLVTWPATGGDVRLLPKPVRDKFARLGWAEELGVSFISHQADDLANPHVARLKRAGLHVLCWTVRSPEEEARAREIAENVTFEGYLPAIPPA